MADNNDDLFGGPQQKTEHNDVEVEDLDGDNQYHQEDEVNEEDAQKEKELRKKKKQAFVKRYLMEKEWWKEEQRKAEEQKRKEQEMMKKRMQQFTNQDQLSILEKYERQDKEDEFFKPITKFKGPTSERVLTNKYCIYLWVVLNAFFAFTAIYVLNDGRPNRLSNGYDFRTEICGNGKYADKPYLYYANPVLDIRVAICMDQCPTSSGPLICLYDTDGVSYESQYKKFCYIQMQAKLRSKYCVPNEPKNQAVVTAKLESFDISVKRYASDINMSVDILLCGSLLTVILAFFFLYLLKKDSTVACFVSATFFLQMLCFAGLAFMFYREYLLELDKNCFTLRDEKDCVGSRGYSYRAGAIVVIVFGGIYVLVLMFLSKRIVKIVGFLKLASQVVEILQQIKWLPFYILAVAIVIAALALINVPFGLSVAEVLTVDSNDGAISGGKLKIMEFSSFAYFIGFYDFFIFVIWMLFLLGFRDLFVSYSITLWFFTKRKDTVLIPKWVIFKNILRYHVGTIVMYSLISTIITFPKLMIMTLRKSLRSLPQYLNSVRYFQATCNCCLFSYEKFLRYFSKSSLVQVAITSMEFYPSSKIAYFLVFRNKEKISDMDQMQQFVVNNIKFLISFMAGLFVYVILCFIDVTPLTSQNTAEIDNKFLPGVVMFIFAYFFSAIFIGSYDITCRSVIQCYLIDQEIFYGENRYVEPFIKNVFEYYVKEDLEKYKLQSKAGVILDEQKAQKKEDLSDDDKQYQSEEEDSQASAEDLKAKSTKQKTEILNDNTRTTPIVSKAFNDSTINVTKPNIMSTLNTQSNITGTPQRLITAEKAGVGTPQQQRIKTSEKLPVREQELINLDNSNDSDDYNTKKFNNNTSAINQSNQRFNTIQSVYNTPTLPSTKNAPITIPLQTLQQTGVSPANNNSRINLDVSNNTPGSNQRLYTGAQQQNNPSFFKGRDNTITMQNPTQPRIPSQSNMYGNPSMYTQPIMQNPSQTNFLQNNSQMNQRNYQPSSIQNIRQSNPIFTNNHDDDDDEGDDYGLGANPYAQVNNTINSQQRGTKKNDMRLLNASYASNNVRGQTGQSNASKVSKISKASFDPFVQFQQNQINVDSDDDEDDDD